MVFFFLFYSIGTDSFVVENNDDINILLCHLKYLLIQIWVWKQ